MENHSRVTGCQELFFLYNPLNFRRLPQPLLLRYMAENLQVTFFKGELCSCLPKVDHEINQCKRPISHFLPFGGWQQWFYPWFIFVCFWVW